MIEITKDYISMIAPNASAVKNGKALVDSNAFSNCGIDSSQTAIFASCKGSGTSLYNCFVDFSGESPIFNCTCPSRQIPCKHCVGLLTLKLTKPSTFNTKSLPESIAENRKKKENKKKNTATAKKTTLTSASKKKLEKQLEGLSIAKQFVQETMEKGVASLLSTNIITYENLAKEMGNYYLLGIQSVFWDLLNVTVKGQDKSAELVSCMIKLQQQIAQCETYLTKQIEENRAMPSLEKPYELLGNVWKIEQLKELGAIQVQKQLLQLYFEVKEDNVQKRFEDIGYYMVLDTKEIVKTLNMIPFRAVKHINRDDSIYDVIEVENLVYYPGDKNPRVRMEQVQFKKCEEFHFKSVLEGAISLGEAIKIVKNQLKNPLAEDTVVLAVCVEQFMEEESQVFAVSGKERIALGGDDVISYIKKYDSISYQGNLNSLREGVFVFRFTYHQRKNEIEAMPLSLVTEHGIIRF